ncbi:MAG: alpha/beta fold hydrolase, partial [Myxococcaceae bacterium]
AEPSAADADAKAEAEEFERDPRFLQNDEFGGSDGWLHRFIDYWNGPGTWEAMAPQGRAYAQKLGWKMYQEVRSVFGQSDPADAYRVKVPLTLAIGEKTTAMSRAMTRAMATLNPHAAVEHLKGLGHMALLTRGADVAPSIKRHFDAHAGKK